MTRPLVSILSPTRGRPDLFKRMCDSALATAKADVEILAMLDFDDDQIPAYIASAPPNSILTAEFKAVGAMWNELARKSTGQVLMLANDDLVFQTVGWDVQLIEAVGRQDWSDGIWLAWCDDGGPNAANHAAFPFVSRRWFDTLGYFAPECFHFLYHDTWIFDVAKLIGRAVYCPDILIEHRHFTYQKAEYDATYKRHRTGAEQARRRAEDRETYEERAPERQRHADQLLRAINQYANSKVLQ